MSAAYTMSVLARLDTTAARRAAKPSRARAPGLQAMSASRTSRIVVGAPSSKVVPSTCRARSVRVTASAAEEDSSDIADITDNINRMPNVCDISTTNSCTVFVAETKLPTTSGFFRVRAYRHWYSNLAPSEPLAMICGDVEGLSEVPVRVHDACFTSEVLGSLKCDCAEQLQYALDWIRKEGPGVVVYLQQEGRGIGLANKIAAYHMQEKGYDTVDANRALNLPDDSREYSAVANILKDLDIKSIKLMTNNPRKIERLSSLGVDVVDRIPVEIEAQEHSEGYLKVKGERMNHIFKEKANEEA